MISFVKRKTLFGIRRVIVCPVITLLLLVEYPLTVLANIAPVDEKSNTAEKGQ